MLKKSFSKINKINYRYFCIECLPFINTNRFVNPYEIAESEEIDIQQIEKYSNNNSHLNVKSPNKKSDWGDETIDME